MPNSAMMKSIALCLILNPSNCQTTKEVIDSYCILYRPLITKKGDAQKFAGVPRAEKEIILGNEQIYRQTCGKS